MATTEQVKEVERLLEIIKIDDEKISDWFTKADVDTWDEMKFDTIQKCIDFLNKKIAPMEAK
jgi:hypothetical protein